MDRMCSTLERNFLFVLLVVLLHVLSKHFGNPTSDDVPRYKHGISITRFSMDKARNGKVLVTEWENLLKPWQQIRKTYRQQRMQHMDQIYKQDRANGKGQPLIASSTPFPCNLTASPLRSSSPPQSVHRLRPGDIDIIAALGDSLTAGNNIISQSILDDLIEYRSLVFATGGRGTWRKFLTLPNILRLYNPNLYGYATEDGMAIERSSLFNVAEPAAMSRDLIYEARTLIKRLNRDSRVNMQHHWKLLTIFIGNVDFCLDICYLHSPELAIEQHERDLRQTLTELRDQVPRLIINLIAPVNAIEGIYRRPTISLLCTILLTFQCPCIFNTQLNASAISDYDKLLTKWQAVDERVAELPEFRTDEFVVNYIGSLARPLPPLQSNGEINLTLFSSDCFHFSQLGQSSLANTLWNNMLQKGANLTMVFEQFLCPTEERPYLVTWGNNEGRGDNDGKDSK